MSLTIFLALCILGVDFLIYVLFQWTFGDKRRAMAKKLEQHRNSMQEQAPRPFVVSPGKAGPETHARMQKVRERMGKSRPRVIRARGTYNERLA
jgi:hypothetical protein